MFAGSRLLLPDLRTLLHKCLHYIPLIKSLEQLLSHPKIVAMINGGPQKCSSGYFYDIIDGELMPSHPLFPLNPLLYR